MLLRSGILVQKYSFQYSESSKTVQRALHCPAIIGYLVWLLWNLASHCLPFPPGAWFLVRACFIKYTLTILSKKSQFINDPLYIASRFGHHCKVSLSTCKNNSLTVPSYQKLLLNETDFPRASRPWVIFQATTWLPGSFVIEGSTNAVILMCLSRIDHFVLCLVPAPTPWNASALRV